MVTKENANKAGDVVNRQQEVRLVSTDIDNSGAEGETVRATQGVNQ